jgi:hypothetical protein
MSVMCTVCGQPALQVDLDDLALLGDSELQARLAKSWQCWRCVDGEPDGHVDQNGDVVLFTMPTPSGAS